MVSQIEKFRKALIVRRTLMLFLRQVSLKENQVVSSSSVSISDLSLKP
jgi:hypothetical protein